MTSFWTVNKTAALAALKMLLNSKRGLRSITTTSVEKSEGSSVATVTGTYWDGTETRLYLDGWPTISIEELGGLYLHTQNPDVERKGKRLE